VFATQPGVVQITWVRNTSVTVKLDGITYHSMRDDSNFALLEQTYVVSGSPVKPVKTIYWTEKASGPAVQVPDAQVNEVNIVYNSNFPERVTKIHSGNGETSIIEDPDEMLQDKRTLWFEYGSLHANNAEGRAFVEYLGAIKGNQKDRVHLGFEIVEVVREAKPLDVTVDLGEAIHPLTDGEKSLDLYPQPVLKALVKEHLHNFTGLDGVRRLYAIRRTENLNDVLVYWMETGEQGIRWPKVYSRYKLQWPLEASKYSHYVRAAVDTEAEAKETGVSLPPENNPILDYQSHENLAPAVISADQKFYTWLRSDINEQPGPLEHRALIRFTGEDKIWFERVYSFLDTSVKEPSSIANAELSGSLWFLNKEIRAIDKPGYFPKTATVGSRIEAPDGEWGAAKDAGYWAGHIHTATGTSYNPNAYIDPMVNGFEDANKGAIIPVNSIPGKNMLEIWWFRKSDREGFKPVYWPSVVGTYTIQWPHEVNKYVAKNTENTIVLASNDGSGPLNSLQAKASIYTKNEEGHGYNPNEEHALMIGGQAYALRDDLNITDPDSDYYSSEPYVLLEFTGSDGRPDMRSFQVLRELDGDIFDYEVEAGTILQAPMPLPLLDKPLVNRFPGKPPVSLNKMVENSIAKSSAINAVAGVSDAKTQITTKKRHHFKDYSIVSLQDTKTSPVTSRWFYLTDVDYENKTLGGFVSISKPLVAGYIAADDDDQPSQANRRRYTLDTVAGFGDDQILVVISQVGKSHWVATVKATDSTDVEKQTIDLEFLPENAPPESAASGLLILTLENGIENNGFMNWRVATEPVPENINDPKVRDFYASFTFQDRKGNLWIYRGPHNVSDTPSLHVQYYYKTQAGFHFPGEGVDQPAVGTITPYLRSELLTDGKVTGYYPDASGVNDRVKGDANNDKYADDNSLAVVYRPKWPDDTPVLLMAQTLTKPAFGLPAVRGQTSLETLYQQSQAQGGGNIDNTSVILHDPTREKEYSLAKDKGDKLHEIPGSVKTEMYRGKTYFPNLPPHLVKRLFYDPNRGKNGALVFKGEFVDEVVGEDYLLLNVAGAQDLAALKGLCPAADSANKTKWNKAIAGLSTSVELFEHNHAKPGTYHAPDSDKNGKANDANRTDVGIQNLAKVTDDDEAVDSYALTARGPGVGYVTLLAGNGLAFTPPGEPVSLQVIKLVPELHPGELKVIAAENPLNEKLTMQQVVDLAGEPQNFDFEWKIAPPIDGIPAEVYKMASEELMGDGSWKHVSFPLVSDLTRGVVESDNHFGKRASNEVKTQVVALSKIPHQSVEKLPDYSDQLQFEVDEDTADRLMEGAAVTVEMKDGTLVDGTVKAVAVDQYEQNTFMVEFPANSPSADNVEKVFERKVSGGPQSIVYRTFEGLKDRDYKELWLSMTLDDALGVDVYIDGRKVVSANQDANNLAKATIAEVNGTGGSDYKVGDVVTLVGGMSKDGNSAAKFVVKAVSDKGEVTGLYSLSNGAVENSIAYLGAYTVAPQNPVETTTSGSGKGLQLNVVFTESLNTPIGTPSGIVDNPLGRAWRLSSAAVSNGIVSDDNKMTHRIAVKLYSDAIVGTTQSFNLRLHGITIEDQTGDGSQWLALDEAKYQDGVRAIIGGTADVKTLSDNYLIMRYRAKNDVVPPYPPGSQKWSQWTEPQLAEGWIKRVLAGINPFQQRAKNLFNNRVDTGVSMLTQAGPRWEGDVALNMANINDYGLVEIYETVLNRGKMLSIDAGINYGPANDALLLAAGYINDLYMFLGNEARADAANPTIGIGTTDGELGSVATALFAFKGQVPSLLEEELGLLRGRDDFLQPGVRTAPAYNRFYWNYTRGIDSGEVIYALNYNITEDEDQGFDGLVNAADAQKMYPQGHGDAYGHYLAALKGYYKLLVDEDFTWAPRTEAVLVLGKPVQVDYLDERKFASAAAATARAGNQVVELTWRKDYKSQKGMGWEHFSATRYNSRKDTTRYWGMDHWGSRTGVGGYLNWVAGNAMLPDEDPDPEHEGIQKIDRQTVPELLELVTLGEELQVTMDNAEGGLNPLGLDENSIAMDIDPHFLEAGSGTFTLTHFDQVYSRAMVALNNAAAAFDDAKGVTEMMRSEENSLSEFKTEVAGEELAYKHELIELYGTPYPDDIGPGKLYAQGYDGPDLYHAMYVDTPEITILKWIEPKKSKTFSLDAQLPPWTGTYDTAIDKTEYDNYKDGPIGSSDDPRTGTTKVDYTINNHGFFEKPDSYKGKRASPGEIQTVISGIIQNTNGLREALESHMALKYQLDREIEIFEQKVITHKNVRDINHALLAAESIYDGIVAANDVFESVTEKALKLLVSAEDVAVESIPTSLIAGLAAGGDMASAARAGIMGGFKAGTFAVEAAGLTKDVAFKILEVAHQNAQRWTPFHNIAPKEWKQEQREAIHGLDMSFGNVQMSIFGINEKLQELDEAKRAYKALLAKGDRIQATREIFRQRSAAITQGFRTRDAGFRIFRNEKLERYKTLFDLSARYSYLAAKAYDYETGLLHTDAGKSFLSRIVSSRALGVMADGEPQFAGSDTGDPGLSSVLAEMKGDFEVLRGRLGFNNPDTQGTTLSLRLENHRILSSSAGAQKWKDVLYRARKSNLLDDADVRRHCMQIDQGGALPVPGLILEFGTTIESGYNALGKPLAGGDSMFTPSNFATKIHGVGIGFENYVGIGATSTNGGSVDAAGGDSPDSPNAPWLEPLSLSKTPHVYLIPVGQDIMRSPPLGDVSVLRSWNVKDVTIPLPFNVGASEFSARSIWQTRDMLSEDLFGIRKHQAFRAVLWENDEEDGPTFSDDGPLYAPSKIVNNRLVGRSVWNTKWKLVIPGNTLLNDPEEGLERFINSVTDIKVHFETYSYSGN
jgi:hypothetical protein